MAQTSANATRGILEQISKLSRANVISQCYNAKVERGYDLAFSPPNRCGKPRGSRYMLLVADGKAFRADRIEHSLYRVGIRDGLRSPRHEMRPRKITVGKNWVPVSE